MKSLLFAAVVTVMVAATSAGSFTNCSSVPFNVTWLPDEISPSKPLKVFFQYTFPHVLDGGTYDATIWFHGDPDPFLEFADSFTCDQIDKYIHCPINKGAKFRGSRVFPHIPNIGSYPGDYDLKLEVKNKAGDEMVCLKGRVIILKN